MATASHNREAIQTIRGQLNGLRRKLTTWIFVHGMGRWLMLILGVFALDMVLDRVFKMDFSQRAIMLALMVIVFAIYLFRKLIRPLSQKIDDDALLMKVENSNEQSKQSIISSYQLAQDDALEEKGISAELTDATIQQGLKSAREVKFGSALDQKRSYENTLLLFIGVVLTALLGTGVWMGTKALNNKSNKNPTNKVANAPAEQSQQPSDALGSATADEASEADLNSIATNQLAAFQGSTDFLGIWFNRNILLGDAQWPQTTYLEIVGANDGKLVIARGSNHTQSVRILEHSKVKDVNVTLQVDGPSGKTYHDMKSIGNNEFRFVFNNVTETKRIRAVGGDGETEWVSFELVEAPAVNDLVVEAVRPDYTLIKPTKLEGSGPHSLLAGSTLNVSMTSNKPLSACKLKIDDSFLDMTSANSDNTVFETALGVDHPLLGGKYEFALTDEQGLQNNRPASFSIKMKEDNPPKVRGELTGISELVVATATVPTRFQIVDDFGISSGHFDCAWKRESDDQLASREIPIFKLPNDEIVKRYEEPQRVLDLAPLELEPGMGLRFNIVAMDVKPDETGIGKSKDFLLRIVTPQELLSDLLRREIKERKSFQQAYDSQLAGITEIRAIAASVPQEGMSPKDFRALQTKQIMAAYRVQKSIGSTVNLVRQRFDDFVVEVKNNHLDDEARKLDPERTLEYRFGTLISRRIRDIDAGGMTIKNDAGEEMAKSDFNSLAVLNLEKCRRAVGDANAMSLAVRETTETQEKILEIMREVLSEMEDSEQFQDVINQFLQLKEEQEGVSEGIKNRGEAPDGIFEKETENKIFDDN